MSKVKNEMFEFISQYISKSDIYAANLIGKISAFICRRRNELGMTQKDFAKFMDVSQGMISKWESADYNFTVESVAKISEKLGYIVDIDFESESEYLANSYQSDYNLPDFQHKYTVTNVAEYGSAAA